MLRMRETDHRISRRVYDIIKDAQLTDPEDTILQIVVDDELIAEHHEILNLWLMHSSWIYTQSDLQHFEMLIDEETVEIRGGYIIAEWQTFVARNGENLKRMLDALFADYDPISNYDMKESGSDGETEDVTHQTPKGKTHTDITPYATGINSTGNGAQQGKQMTETYFSDQAEAETSHDHNKSIPDNAGSSVSGFWKTRQHFFQRHGNIGVTTSAQMITQELELRVVEVVRDFVQRFFDQYCYYVGGGD